MMRFMAWVCAVLLLTAFAGPATAAETPEEAALAASEAWLKLIDAGDFGGSWEQASSQFKAAVPKDKWEKRAAAVCAPLGKVVSRKLKSREVVQTEGATEGRSVVIQFETDFANKPKSIETVTPVLDTDGAWHVSGYTIR